MEVILIISLLSLFFSLMFFVIGLIMICISYRDHKYIISLNQTSKDIIQSLDSRLLSYSNYIYMHVNNRNVHRVKHKHFNKCSPETEYLMDKIHTKPIHFDDLNSGITYINFQKNTQ